MSVINIKMKKKPMNKQLNTVKKNPSQPIPELRNTFENLE